MEKTHDINTSQIQGLGRFLSAQERDFEMALTEVSYGRKRSHWMWYIFPQIQGLGFSDTSKFYAIRDLEEAKQYADHAVLGPRLVTISKELLAHQNVSAVQIFGTPDDLKLRSSMTLFAAVPGANPVFQEVIDRFFGGEKDLKTQRILDLQSIGN